MEGIPWEEEWMLLRELNRLGLSEEILERPFSSLSGGEQTRAGLVRLFCQEDGYPMLDEPTNHLDEAGRDLTARYLRGLDRGFLLVSHDRAFLDACKMCIRDRCGRGTGRIRRKPRSPASRGRRRSGGPPPAGSSR